MRRRHTLSPRVGPLLQASADTSLPEIELLSPGTDNATTGDDAEYTMYITGAPLLAGYTLTHFGVYALETHTVIDRTVRFYSNPTDIASTLGAMTLLGTQNADDTLVAETLTWVELDDPTAMVPGFQYTLAVDMGDLGSGVQGYAFQTGAFPMADSVFNVSGYGFVAGHDNTAGTLTGGGAYGFAIGYRAT